MNALQAKISSGILILLALFAFSIPVPAQDDDGIYGDIYEISTAEEEIIDTVSPLDGYSTVDDYYPEGGYNQNISTTEPYSEQYADENGNGVTNNYYGNYYEDDNDFSYSSRIRRFHRNNSWGYYDPWYTNMYYYNYDPFFWGTSIYIGYRPSFSWGWNSGWGWNSTFGWNQPYGYPACYGGNGWGWGNGGYWNGYNNGCNNGFNDGLATGGYYNTFDSNSGIYYGHRGSGDGYLTSLGSGYRSKTFASAYNQAALDGKVSHANNGNILKTKDGRPLTVSNMQGFTDRRFTNKLGSNSSTVQPSKNVASGSISNAQPNKKDLVSNNRAIDSNRSGFTTSNTQENPYQRPTTQSPVTKPTRLNPNNVDRSRDRTLARPRTNSQSAGSNVYQRGYNRGATRDNRQVTRPNSNNDLRNISRDIQRSTPNSNGYNRGNSNGNDYTRPTRPNTNSRNNGYRPPSKSNTQPSRSTQPSRGSKPSRSVTPNRGGSSSRGSYSTPSRSSGSSSGRSSGSRSSGSKSRGGRP